MSDRPKPIDVLAAVESWPECWRERFEERAGIKEYDGGMSREEAEREAWEEYRREVGRG